MADLVVVRSKIKEYSGGCNISSDFGEALSKKVVELIKEASERAKANKRNTIKPRDL